MGVLRDFFRGLVASFSLQALAALGWVYAACLALGLAFTLLVYRFVERTVAGSAMAEELRQGQTANWIVDLIGRPATMSSVVVLATAGTLLAIAYLALAVFFSGGVIAKVRAALGLSGPERFFAASGRHVGPMARVAAVEILVVGLIAFVLFVGQVVGGFSGTASAIAWSWLTLSIFVLALVTAAFDYARIHVVAGDDRSAIEALAGGFRFAGRRAPAVAALAALNCVLALAVTWALVWLHSVVGLDTGAGVFLGIVVGQLGVLGRLWSRVVAYASETALWERTSAE